MTRHYLKTRKKILESQIKAFENYVRMRLESALKKEFLKDYEDFIKTTFKHT